MAQRWYVAETLPRREHLALKELAKQSFAALLPEYVRSRPKRRQEPIVPLFPGYLFVRFDVLADEWGAIKSTRGLRRLVCATPYLPAALPDCEALKLLEHFGRGPVPDLEDALLPFRVGTALRVLDGPFTGLVAPCERSTRTRVWMLLSWLGRILPAEFEIKDVEVAA